MCLSLYFSVLCCVSRAYCFTDVDRCPEGASCNDALQSYHELEKEANEHYGAYQQAMAYLKPDFNPFSEEIKSQTPADAK